MVCLLSQEDEDSDCTCEFIVCSKAWILDSSCTYHMCPNRDLVSSFEELDFGIAFIESGHACKTLDR